MPRFPIRTLFCLALILAPVALTMTGCDSSSAPATDGNATFAPGESPGRGPNAKTTKK